MCGSPGLSYRRHPRGDGAHGGSGGPAGRGRAGSRLVTAESRRHRFPPAPRVPPHAGRTCAPGPQCGERAPASHCARARPRHRPPASPAHPHSFSILILTSFTSILTILILLLLFVSPSRPQPRLRDGRPAQPRSARTWVPLAHGFGGEEEGALLDEHLVETVQLPVHGGAMGGDRRKGRAGDHRSSSNRARQRRTERGPYRAASSYSLLAPPRCGSDQWRASYGPRRRGARTTAVGQGEHVT